MKHTTAPALDALNDPFAVFPVALTAGSNSAAPANGGDPCADELEPEPEESAWELIDDLMAGLPGPDGCSEPLGIAWHSGQVTGAPFWHEQLTGFGVPLVHDGDYANPALRAALRAKVARLRGLGEQMRLGSSMISRIVYDFLISVVYACEARS